jgi:glycosidase
MPAAANPGSKAQGGIPTWAHEARWYHMVVSRFHNGDRSNDPANTLPWTTDWPTKRDPSAGEASELDGRSYGGDLQGLGQRLGYLKELGVNTLYLTSVFQTGPASQPGAVNLPHVHDSLGVPGSSAQAVEPTLDPKTSTFSASDRVFLDVLNEAHRQGFRIVVELVFSKSAADKHLAHIVRRWMDPNSDGNPSEGVDGWVICEPSRAPHEFWKRWRKDVKKVNGSALLVCDVAGDASPWLHGDEFDVAIDHRLADALHRFFGKASETSTLEDLFRTLTAISEDRSLDARLATPRPLGGPRAGRLLTALARSAVPSTGAGAGISRKLDNKTVGRQRLATVLQYFCPGSPMIYYGDEAGMVGGNDALSRAPMWWKDLPAASSKPTAYREDFVSLVQWLNVRRDLHAPLRKGAFRTVMQDAKRRVFAFARSLPGDEVILVVNYGNANQQVTLPAGTPGQLVGVLSPRFDQPARGKPTKKRDKGPGESYIQPLRLGGSRQIVDSDGNIRVRLDPMSVRAVLISDKEPQ